MRIVIKDVIYTKAQLKKECSRILNFHNPGEVLKGKDRIVLLWCLIQRKKPNLTLESKIEIVVMQTYGVKCFGYVEQDRAIDFSFKKAIQEYDKNKAKKVSKSLIKSAFRLEVWSFIKEFRDEQLSKPENKTFLEMALVDNYSVHTDHIVPFFVLVEDFLALENIPLEKVELKKYNHSGFRDNSYILKDRDLAKRWFDFHKKNARLRLLDKQTNISRGCSEALVMYHYRKRMSTKNKLASC